MRSAATWGRVPPETRHKYDPVGSRLGLLLGFRQLLLHCSTFAHPRARTSYIHALGVPLLAGHGLWAYDPRSISPLSPVSSCRSRVSRRFLNLLQDQNNRGETPLLRAISKPSVAAD